MTSNIIGNIGENIIALRLSKYGIFKVYFLGEKAPIEDFLLEILDEATPYQCLTQVKAVGDREKQYTQEGNMNTPVPKEKLKKLINRPLPTYVGGADIEKEVVYIAAAFDPNIKYSSIPPKLKIDNEDKERSKRALIRLRDDIINYWNSIQIHNYKSSYQSTF